MNIRILEKEPALSGRTRSVTVDGRVVELGASIAYTGEPIVDDGDNDDGDDDDDDVWLRTQGTCT